MERVAERLAKAGIVLPFAPSPAGAYVPAVMSGALVFTSGQLPMSDGTLLYKGPVPDVTPVEQARQCARQCAINALAAASSVCDLDDVRRVVKLVAYVACSEEFVQQPQVVDAASEILILAFGEDGRHAREAIGVSALPLGAPVELSLVLEMG